MSDISLYAGIAGASLAVEKADLGHGVTITQTYAHLMAPFMMAFAPAPPGKPHPAPWRAAKGGFGFDITVQVEAPPHLPVPLDQKDTLWLLAALLRLRIGPRLIVPVLANAPFAQALKSEDITFWPLEVEPRFLDLNPESRTSITALDLAWLKKYWISTERLLEENSEFSLTLQASDQSMFARHASLALVWMWGALETLFSSGRNELRYRVSTAIASYLEPAGLGRLSLQKQIVKLYDARSAAAHGRNEKANDALHRTYDVIRRVVLKMIEDEHVPTKAELDAKVFGADPE
jgi:hypothetical protein